MPKPSRAKVVGSGVGVVEIGDCANVKLSTYMLNELPLVCPSLKSMPIFPVEAMFV